MENPIEEHALKLDRESYFYRKINEKAFFLRKEFNKPIDWNSIDITGSRAIIGTGYVKGGHICFHTNHGDIKSNSGLFGFYIPPYSIYKGSGHFETLKLFFYISSEPKLTNIHPKPLLFSSDIKDFNGSEEQIEKLLKNIDNNIEFPISLQPDPRAEKAKKIIDYEYQNLYRISTLSRRLNIENWELSRVFKKSYGISPLKYLNSIRTIEAIYRILNDGKKSKIIDIAFNVGFRDLSRFNKQFKSFTRFIPRALFPKK